MFCGLLALRGCSFSSLALVKTCTWPWNRSENWLCPAYQVWVCSGFFLYLRRQTMSMTIIDLPTRVKLLICIYKCNINKYRWSMDYCWSNNTPVNSGSSSGKAQVAFWAFWAPAADVSAQRYPAEGSRKLSTLLSVFSSGAEFHLQVWDPRIGFLMFIAVQIRVLHSPVVPQWCWFMALISFSFFFYFTLKLYLLDWKISPMAEKEHHLSSGLICFFYCACGRWPTNKDETKRILWNQTCLFRNCFKRITKKSL